MECLQRILHTATAVECLPRARALSMHATPPRCSIILENSGVAEPQNIRDQFNDAIALGDPLMKRIYLDTLVTGALAGHVRLWLAVPRLVAPCRVMTRAHSGHGSPWSPVALACHSWQCCV